MEKIARISPRQPICQGKNKGWNVFGISASRDFLTIKILYERVKGETRTQARVIISS